MKSIFVLTDSRNDEAIRACATMEKAIAVAIRRIAFFNYDCRSFNYDETLVVIEYVDRVTGTLESLTIIETIFDEEE
jgi:AAA15 family ATPase/GTPase